MPVASIALKTSTCISQAVAEKIFSAGMHHCRGAVLAEAPDDAVEGTWEYHQWQVAQFMDDDYTKMFFTFVIAVNVRTPSRTVRATRAGLGCSWNC